MKKKTRICLLVLVGLIFAGSLTMLLTRALQYRRASQTDDEAVTMANLPDFSEEITPPVNTPPESGDPATEAPPEKPKPVYVDPYAKALRKMDFTALREANPNVFGWILIPGTPISYPVVQGKDNQYYLKRNWKTWNSVVGSIFLECENNRDLSDFNTIIYGHRMNNGSMFASLKHYKKQSYWAAHPTVYLTDDSGAREYEIFAAYEVSTQGSTYRLGFADEAAKQKFLDDCVGLSVIQTGVTPTVKDHILTLSTCTGNGHATRWVVQARLEPPAEPVAEPPKPAESTAPATAPTAPAQPPVAPAASPAPAQEPAAPPADSPPQPAADTPDA